MIGAIAGERTRVIRVDGGSDLLDAVFAELVTLQHLACRAAEALGRDVDAWLGGRRTAEIQQLSLRTIRGSRVLGAEE